MTSEGRPSFTVAVATYRRPTVLARLLDALGAQTDPPEEVIVVDDGSNDGTARVALDALRDGWHYVHQENAGLSAARNRAAMLATGDWLVFIDDDDTPTPGWIESFRQAATSDRALVSCGATLVSPDGVPIGSMRPISMGAAFGAQQALMLAGCFAVRSDVFRAVGGYLDGLRCSHQTELALRLLPYCTTEGLHVAATDEELVLIERRSPGERPMASPEALFQGATLILRLHESRLEADPQLLDGFLAIAGVSAARLGQFRTARSLLWRALRRRPSRLRPWTRLLLASVPPLGRRVWSTDDFADEPEVHPAARPPSATQRWMTRRR